MNNEKMYDELTEFLKMAVSNGVKEAYISNDKSYLYGFVIMPNDVVLEITEDSFESWQVCFPYVPCQHAGSGCQVLNELRIISWEDLLQSEIEGFALAYKYNAIPYHNSNEWKRQCWSYKENRLNVVAQK